MPGRRMTFAEAEQRSRALADEMLLAGVGKGTRIGLFFTYGHDFVVAWLAALRIGALVMPFSTTYRPAELRTVLRIGDVHTLLAPSRLLGRDVLDVLEETAPGLADAAADGLFLPALPHLRSVWIVAGGPRVGHGRSRWTGRDRAVDGGRRRQLSRQSRARSCPPTSAQVTYTSGSSALPRASCTPTAPSCGRPRRWHARPATAPGVRGASFSRSRSSGSAGRSCSAAP